MRPEGRSLGLTTCLAGLGLALLLSLASRAGEPRPLRQWPDNFVARLEALALLQTLNAELLSHDSATLTLEHWCDAHHLATPPRIVADRVRDSGKQATAEQRELLKVGPADRLEYRHVRLRCGDHVLSEADNWYVPARLTDEMNRVLETTDTPFGRAVQALHFQRHTLVAKLLWQPLPEGWEQRPPPPATTRAALSIPAEVLQHQAILTDSGGMPFSQVIETYTADVLGVAPP